MVVLGEGRCEEMLNSDMAKARVGGQSFATKVNL